MNPVLANTAVGDDFYLLTVQCDDKPHMGQFYMLRAWKHEPLLSRPISVYDADAYSISFLFRTVGEGTRLLSRLKSGESVETGRVHGNGFPIVNGRIALVGGGAGIAPLHYAARQLRPCCTEIDVYLGFSRKVILKEEYESISDHLVTKVQGYITDEVNPEQYDYIFACGPERMMKAMNDKCRQYNCEEKLYVSLESRMACGIGVCLGCTRETILGRKRICKDGPVFPAGEVFFQ